MSKVIKLKQGLDINLTGKAEKTLFSKTGKVSEFSLKPSDFPTLKPHLEIKAGDTVKAGSVLFTDKNQPEICFCSPVSGTVSEIRRAERRRITDVIIKSDGKDEYERFDVQGFEKKSAAELKQIVLKSGVWPYIIQRPFGIVADAKTTPKAVYISCFDSAPLAVDYQFSLRDDVADFQTGINVIKKIAEAPVYLGLDAKNNADIFMGVTGVEINKFDGPHPAGNAGVQIHHICPINKGETVWTLDPQAVVILGRLFNKGIYDANKTIAIAGSGVKNPAYVKTIANSAVATFVNGNLAEGEQRIISGNVLSGTQITADGYLGFYDNQITVIPEGKEYEFMGWAAPGLGKFSFSHTFLSWLTPNKQYALNTNMHGEKRAYVVTGTFEKLVPMDILPLQLIKAILAENIELMENLGIYEIVPEDFALCEFADTSKTDIQAIVRKGLDLMVAETR